MDMMSGPRCGTEQTYNATDAEDALDVERRYVLWGPKWAKTTLTWRFDSYTNDLSTARQQSTIRLVKLPHFGSSPLCMLWC